MILKTIQPHTIIPLQQYLLVTCLCLGLFLFSCQTQSSSEEIIESSTPEGNPAARGFNAEASDQKAIEIADKVMIAMGGRKNWDQTRYLTWNFFGRRTHTWDRYEGRDSISIPADSMIIDMNVHTMEGKVFRGSQEILDPDSLQKYLERGKSLWINDSYWLIMPFKLKDSGVTLKYLGQENSGNGDYCNKLQLTFEGVGRTPENKYEVYVDTARSLVCEWKYFPEFTMDSAALSTPWTDYEKHGNILLSGNRGKYALSDIRVKDQWAE